MLRLLLSKAQRCTAFWKSSKPCHVGTDKPGGGGGGVGTQVERGGAPALHISRKKVFFLRPPHVRDFVKEGYFLYPGTKYGGQNPLKIHEIYAALTPSDYRSDWASEFAAATCCR